MRVNKNNYRFLIDTGSSISLIKPKIFPTPVIKIDPICVKTATGNIILDETQEIFSPIKKSKLTFLVFEFGSGYDGLLGFDNLKKLNASINIPMGFVSLNNIKYFFFERKSKRNGRHSKFPSHKKN